MVRWSETDVLPLCYATNLGAKGITITQSLTLTLKPDHDQGHGREFVYGGRKHNASILYHVNHHTGQRWYQLLYFTTFTSDLPEFYTSP